MHTKTLTELKAGLAAGDFSSRELTEHFLARIKQYDGELNSFVTVTEEQALAQADAADATLATNRASSSVSGLLTGLQSQGTGKGDHGAIIGAVLGSRVVDVHATLLHLLRQLRAQRLIGTDATRHH